MINKKVKELQTSLNVIHYGVSVLGKFKRGDIVEVEDIGLGVILYRLCAENITGNYWGVGFSIDDTPLDCKEEILTLYEAIK